MNKTLCAFQNTEAKTLPADVCVFGCIGQLSPAAVHSADFWFNSGVKWWIYVSSIVTHLCKNFFFCVETVANNALNCEHIVFNRLWANPAPTLNTAFSLTNVHAKWWIHCLMIIFNSSAISCNFNLRLAKTSLWSFLVFSGTAAKFGWPEHLALFVSVQLHLKSA